jgi:hypothetical protein
MGTKRQRRPQGVQRRITAEAVDAWRRMQAGEERYFRCTREPDARCDSTTKGRHCEPCLAYLEASLELDRALGLKPWEDVEDDPDLVDALDDALEQERS